MTDEDKYEIDEYRAEDFYICVCDISGIDDGLDMSLFSEYRKQRLSSLKPRGARLCSIGAELMLIHAIRRCMPDYVLPASVRTDKNGKPELAGQSGVYMSLSHSGTKAVCMLSRRRCGVDIQKAAGDNQRIAKRYYTELEKAECGRGGFTRIWARKEAVAKADGRGIAIGFDTYDVCGNICRVGNDEYNICDIKAPAGYVIAAAYKK